MYKQERLTNYKNTSEDCLRWFDNNKVLFNDICDGLGITTKMWKSFTSTERSEFVIAVYHVFLQNQEKLNLN